MEHLIIIIFTIFLVFLSFDLTADFKDTKIKNLIRFLPFLFLTIILGIQHEVGTDYHSYINKFKSSVYLSYDEVHLEFALYYIFKFLNVLGFSYRALFIVTAFIEFIFIYLFLKRENLTNNWLFFLGFFSLSNIYFQSFNLIPQMIAVSIFLFSIRFIEERKFILYSLTILLGFLFHKSIILLLPIYFIYNIRLSLIPRLIYFISLFIVAVNDFVIKIIFWILSKVKIFNYNAYLNHKANTFQNVEFGLGVGIAILIIVISVLIVNQKKLSPKRCFYVNLSYLYFFIHYATINYMTFHRMSLYFSIFYIFLIYEVFISLKKYSKEVAGIYIFGIIGYLGINLLKSLLLNPYAERIYNSVLF
jgi:hypothetical protein